MSEHVGLLTDPGIATLAEVLDPAALSQHLRGVSLGSWDGEAVEEIQTRLLRHHEHLRCTLEIGLRTDHGWHFLIGKVYHRDRLDVFQAMEKIQQAGFGPHEEFSIPQPSSNTYAEFRWVLGMRQRSKRSRFGCLGTTPGTAARWRLACELKRAGIL